jgi:zinc transport system ATP-binding protein
MEQDFQDLLGRLGGRMTVVIVSHDVGFVSSRISKVVCVHGGVAVHATTELSGEMLREIYGRDVSLVRHDTSIPPSAKEADHE